MNATRQRQGHADGAVGDILGAVIGHVAHGNATGAGKFVIDVVDAHAAADDQLAML